MILIETGRNRKNRKKHEETEEKKQEETVRNSKKL